MIPHRTPFILPLLYPSLTWRLPADQKRICLTFDDGPVYGPTEFVLETLKQFNIRGTFFCIGDNIRKHPEVFQRIVHEGHAIGNHTFHHVKGWSTTVPDYLHEVDLCTQEILKHDPKPVSLFRPPYGRIKRSQARQLSAYQIIMWDVLSLDYNKSVSPDACLQGTIRATRPGSVVVFHDSVKAEKNMVYALPRFIEHFLERDYRFTLLS
ncbi:MAG TPA: polysaccharide deacetylase family protein [Ohtaekwangia sp.]